MIAVTNSQNFAPLDRQTDEQEHQCTCVCRYTKICSLKKHLPEIVTIAGYFLLHCGHQSFIALQPARAGYLGYSNTQGAFLVSMYGIMSGAFRIPMGWLGDRPCVRRVVLCGAGGIFAGVCTVCSVFLTDYNVLLVYAGFYGLGIGRLPVYKLIFFLFFWKWKSFYLIWWCIWTAKFEDEFPARRRSFGHRWL